MELRKTKGFTLIEILVVIAVLSVLTFFGIFGYNTAISKSRDARRKQDLKEIQMSLEAYYVEHGSYPLTNWVSSKNNQEWIPGMANYLPQIPQDPINSLITGQTLWDSDDNHVYMYYGGLNGEGSAPPPSPSPTPGPPSGGQRRSEALAECYPPNEPGQFYILTTRLENENDPQSSQVLLGSAHCPWEYPGSYTIKTIK